MVLAVLEGLGLFVVWCGDGGSVGPDHNGACFSSFTLSHRTTRTIDSSLKSMASREQRPPHVGDRQSLVISFDVGTTFSGASYAFLTPGEVPQIHSVTGCVVLIADANHHLRAQIELNRIIYSYQGQEDQASSSKVPTVLIYTPGGDLVACGAEASDEIMDDNPEYMKVEW